MSTHPTILGDMIRTETETKSETDSEKTSLDVERDLGIPAGAEGDTAGSSRPDLLQTERKPGQRRESAESE